MQLLDEMRGIIRNWLGCASCLISTDSPSPIGTIGSTGSEERSIYSAFPTSCTYTRKKLARRYRGVESFLQLWLGEIAGVATSLVNTWSEPLSRRLVLLLEPVRTSSD